MRIAGQRRCTECDARWSYFETGATACPACGSLRSVSTGGAPARHTDVPAALDLTAARTMLDDRPVREVAATAAETAREYERARGFIRGGTLEAFDDTVLAAAELARVGDHMQRALESDDPARNHFLALLAGAPAGDRPATAPEALWHCRGLAVAAVGDRYRLAATDRLEDPPGPDVRRALDGLRSHARRIEALDGDVPPADADLLASATRELGEHLRTGEPDALVRAEEYIAGLD